MSNVLRARVARVSRVLSRVAAYKTARGAVASDAVAAFQKAASRLKSSNIHVKDVKIHSDGLFGDTSAVHAQIVIEPDSYTVFGVDPLAKPVGEIFVILESGDSDDAKFELNLSCGRSVLYMDIQKGKIRVSKRSHQVTKNFDEMAKQLAQAVASAYTRYAMAKKTAAPKPVVTFKPFDKPRIYGDSAFAHILLDGEYAGEIERVMDVEYVGMGRTYRVSGYHVTLTSDRFPEDIPERDFDVIVSKRPGGKSVTAKEALKAAKDWARAEIAKAIGGSVAVDDSAKSE